MPKFIKSSAIKPLAYIGAALLVSGCIEKEKIAKVPDAENILFTTQGQLFVSGGTNIYQVKATENSDGTTSYKEDPVYFGDRKCAFGGIAQSGDWAFSVCKELYLEWKGWTLRTVQDTHLLAADLTKEHIVFKPLDEDLENDPMDTMFIPNGIGFAPTGELIIADTNFFAPSTVGRITLDYSGDYPRVTHFNADWLGSEYGFESPNGVRVDGDTMYISDANKVRRLFFNEAGEVPLLFDDANGDQVSNLPDDNEFYTGGIIVDDIMPYCGGIAVTHFAESKLVFQNAAGDASSRKPVPIIANCSSRRRP